MVQWVSSAFVDLAHDYAIDQSGGVAGPPNEGCLEATLAKPQNMIAYGNQESTIVDLAAVYGFGFAKNHCYADGNKRVAFAVTIVFLDLNGFEFFGDQDDSKNVMLSLSDGGLSQNEFSDWLLKNSYEREAIKES